MTSASLLLVLCAGTHAALPGARAALSPPRPFPTHLHALRVRGGQSSMSAALVAERICPAFGFVLSSALYCSPLPTLRESVKRGSIGSFNPLPSALMVIGTTSWLGYALSVRDPWIAVTNGPGTLVALYQLVTLLPLMRPGPQLRQFQATILGGAACTTLLWARLIFAGVGAAARSRALGMYATVICIALFASPLSTIATVVRTRDAASILAPLTVSQVANCLMWTVYGVLAAKDPFVWGPNGTGLVLGLVQLALKLCFPSKEANSS
ncbi:hypothetical protein AB1Y20_010670 [Prymnesium parvum]|uniref:Sugar transporter SWEET1 n=1 Tax=Prymnesium parvum TaxID=97485 RepID=A0AB34IPE2_PRYPA